MTRYSKFNVIYRIQKWIDSVPGQTFLNYAYSWGASIVILGTLFKLTHLPGANLMLYIGMGTEVIVFFISAFDRPFDKTAIDMELPTHFEDEEEMFEEPQPTEEEENTEDGVHITEYVPISVGEQEPEQQPTEENQPAIQQPAANIPAAQPVVPVQPQPALSAEVAEATSNYIEKLEQLTQVLTQVEEQSQRLTRDSEEMENLNRTLCGISRIYEMQLKGASQQIGTIDQINEQTKHMAAQIAELNQIYARMIEAMSQK